MLDKKNKTLKYSFSIFLTFCVLTIICFFYYNVPVHHDCKDDATDYVWKENKTYYAMTEGYGFGYTNNEGYMNLYDYEEDMPIDVLFMGSSHMQGFQININDNCAVILDEMLESKNVYNIAVTGHNIKTCISNLDAALNKYKPSVVVIETSNINLSEDNINKILNNEIKELTSSNNKIINLLQSNPFLRQCYTQLTSVLSNNVADEDTVTNISDDFNIDATNRLLEYINSICAKYNTKPIIIYHPTINLNNDGMTVNNNINISNSFNELCEKNNISFIDMSNRYIEEYKKNNIIPTGFSNTAVGVGHINKYAHRMFAQELYKVIKEID